MNTDTVVFADIPINDVRLCFSGAYRNKKRNFLFVAAYMYDVFARLLFCPRIVDKRYIYYIYNYYNIIILL